MGGNWRDGAVRSRSRRRPKLLAGDHVRPCTTTPVRAGQRDLESGIRCGNGYWGGRVWATQPPGGVFVGVRGGCLDPVRLRHPVLAGSGAPAHIAGSGGRESLTPFSIPDSALHARLVGWTGRMCGEEWGYTAPVTTGQVLADNRIDRTLAAQVSCAVDQGPPIRGAYRAMTRPSCKSFGRRVTRKRRLAPKAGIRQSASWCTHREQVQIPPVAPRS